MYIASESPCTSGNPFQCRSRVFWFSEGAKRGRVGVCWRRQLLRPGVRKDIRFRQATSLKRRLRANQFHPSSHIQVLHPSNHPPFRQSPPPSRNPSIHPPFLHSILHFRPSSSSIFLHSSILHSTSSIHHSSTPSTSIPPPSSSFHSTTLQPTAAASQVGDVICVVCSPPHFVTGTGAGGLRKYGALSVVGLVAVCGLSAARIYPR
jgi:hypothetical protein